MGVFHLKFPKFQRNFFDTLLTFSIGNIKSRDMSVGQVILHCYDVNGTELVRNKVGTLTGDKSIIQTGDDVALTAQIVDADNNPLQEEGVKVHFYRKIDYDLSLSADTDIIQSGDDLDISCTISSDDGGTVSDKKVYFYKKIGEDDPTVVNNPVFTGERFVITDTYHSYVQTISLPANILSKIYELEIELVLYGITSENPCWFNQIMLEKGADHTEYHKPNEALAESRILFNNNNYAVIYSDETHSLQVIRPQEHDDITTKKLLKSKYTILAPHLDNEPATDTPANLMMEFINQTEQYISIQK